jgi:hypothetical protein
MFARKSNRAWRAAVISICSAGLAAAAAGCSSTSSLSAAHLSDVTPSAQAATASSSAPATAPRLTLAQAKTEYEKISAPYNAAVTTVNADAKKGVTWPAFHADLLNAVATNKTWVQQIKAQRWPTSVQSLIDSMLKTEVPAEINCDQSMADSGSLQGAANVFSDNSACKDSPATADEVRKILGLPATIG